MSLANIINGHIEQKITDVNTEKYEKLSDILKIIIDKCGIDNNKYMIIASYCIRKYRHINDLDMNMEKTEWEKLRILEEAGIGKIETYNGQLRYFLDMTKKYNELVDPDEKDFSIEIFKKDLYEGYPNNDFSLGYLLDHNGLDRDENKHLFFSKPTLLKWKRTANRPKDQKDIQLLENLVKLEKKGKTKRCPKGKRRNKKTRKCVKK